MTVGEIHRYAACRRCGQRQHGGEQHDGGKKHRHGRLFGVRQTEDAVQIAEKDLGREFFGKKLRGALAHRVVFLPRDRENAARGFDGVASHVDPRAEVFKKARDVAGQVIDDGKAHAKIVDAF